MLKNFLNYFFGYRWSVYINRYPKNLFYVMHSDSVIKMIGFIMNFYLRNGNPKDPWEIHINFNKNHSSFKLDKKYFKKDGIGLTKDLIKKIETIDPGYRVKSNSKNPIIKDVKNNRNLELEEFFSIMRENVFKKN